MNTLNFLSWLAVAILAASYWFQIWKIHVHKEVRDLSIRYHILLAIGFGILIFTAWYEDSTIFLAKQIATFIPVIVIIWQIRYHKKDKWRNKGDHVCKECNSVEKTACKYCNYCSICKK